jgi:hypothetical protein
MEMKERFTLNPEFDAWNLVASGGFFDEMEFEVRWRFAVDLLKESDQFLVPMAWQTITDELPIKPAEGCKQRISTISLVIVRHSPTPTSLQRETQLSSFEGLKLTFLVDAQD